MHEANLADTRHTLLFGSCNAFCAWIVRIPIECNYKKRARVPVGINPLSCPELPFYTCKTDQSATFKKACTCVSSGGVGCRLIGSTFLIHIDLSSSSLRYCSDGPILSTKRRRDLRPILKKRSDLLLLRQDPNVGQAISNARGSS